MTHYKDWLKEYKNQDLISTDDGFITYEIIPDLKTVHVGEVYTIPLSRKQGCGAKLIVEVSELAKKQNCVQMITFIYNNNKGKDASVSAALNCGFKITNMDHDKLTLSREI